MKINLVKKCWKINWEKKLDKNFGKNFGESWKINTLAVATDIGIGKRKKKVGKKTKNPLLIPLDESYRVRRWYLHKQSYSISMLHQLPTWSLRLLISNFIPNHALVKKNTHTHIHKLTYSLMLESACCGD